MVTVSPLSLTKVYKYTFLPSTLPQSVLVIPAFIGGAFLFSAPLLQATVKVARALAPSINFTNFMMIDFDLIIIMIVFLVHHQNKKQRFYLLYGVLFLVLLFHRQNYYRKRRHLQANYIIF